MMLDFFSVKQAAICLPPYLPLQLIILSYVLILHDFMYSFIPAYGRGELPS